MIMQRLDGSELIPDLNEASEQQGMRCKDWVGHRFKAVFAGKGMTVVSSTR